MSEFRLARFVSIVLLLLFFSCEKEDLISLNSLDDNVEIFEPRTTGCRVKRISSTNNYGTGSLNYLYDERGAIQKINTGNNNFIGFGYNMEGRIDSIYFTSLQGHYFIIHWNGSFPARREMFFADTLYSALEFQFDEQGLLKEVASLSYNNNQVYRRGFEYFFDNKKNMLGWKIEDNFYLGYAYLRYDEMRNFRKLLGFNFLFQDIYSDAIQSFSSNNVLYVDENDRQRKYLYQYNDRGYPVLVREYGAEATLIIEYENCE
jgi:hypothetical protein